MSDNPNQMTFADFLINSPPDTQAEVTVTLYSPPGRPGETNIALPELQMHCASCDGMRCFVSTADSTIPVVRNKVGQQFLRYYCRNCRSEIKYFALLIGDGSIANATAEISKVGEFPAFGPHIPRRFRPLIGDQQEIFNKGLRAECRGLGIGAFAYYRRVVDDNKNRLLDAIIKVGQKSGATPAVIEVIERAKEESQFTKAIDDIKEAIPDAIRIKGQNPLTLLYRPLSVGIHSLTDEQCLVYATDIRLILFAMAERIDAVLKDDKALDEAIKRLGGPIK